MSAIIPFESSKLPAHIASMFQVSTDLMSGGGGFPVISIKGKVFHIKRGDEKTLITKPDAPDEPAASIEVVILKAFPGGGKTAKVYYDTGYSEGSDAAPTCYSNDGTAPAADAESPQAKSCASCVHNQWGSKITENGAKGRACGDTKRLAVAPVGQLNDPMLLRVPAASLKALSQFNDTLVKRGVPYQAVVTKVGFDYSVAHPALTFKPIGFLDEASMAEVAQEVESDLVKQITGQVEMPKAEKAESFEQEKPKADAKSKPAVKPAPAVDDLPTEKKASVKVKPAKPAEVVEAASGLASALDSIDFDD